MCCVSFWGVSPAQCTIYTLPYLPTCTYYPSDHVDKKTSAKRRSRVEQSHSKSQSLGVTVGIVTHQFQSIPDAILSSRSSCDNTVSLPPPAVFAVPSISLKLRAIIPQKKTSNQTSIRGHFFIALCSHYVHTSIILLGLCCETADTAE